MPYVFKFFISGTLVFEAALVSERCRGITKEGHRCKRMTVIGKGLCYNHLLKEKNLRIKQSTVRGLGKGLFALDNNQSRDEIVFKKGEKIIEYGGEVLTSEELDDRYEDYTAPYGLEVNKSKNIYEDGALERGIGTLCNHSVQKANARFSVNRNNKVSLVATKNIKNNSEIFIDYGTDYGFNEPTRHMTKYMSKLKN